MNAIVLRILIISSSFTFHQLKSTHSTQVIFLDIDGVVRPITESGFSMNTVLIDGISVPLAGCGSDFPSTAIAAVRYIVEATGAVIVLSSEWRRHASLKKGVEDKLKHEGMSLHDATTTELELGGFINAENDRSEGGMRNAFAERRVREIGTYLKAHPDITSWVALDDVDLSQADRSTSRDKPVMRENFVHTCDRVGLTYQDARRAVHILDRKPVATAAPGPTA